MKLEHYGKGGLANIWFESYLLHSKHHISVNNYYSNLTAAIFGFPQGSVPGSFFWS